MIDALTLYGDQILGVFLIALALGFWLGEWFGKRTARPRIVWRTAPPRSVRVDRAASRNKH